MTRGQRAVTANSASACAKHTPCPEGYLAWHEWANKKMKSHRSVRCKGCGLFKVWVRR